MSPLYQANENNRDLSTLPAFVWQYVYVMWRVHSSYFSQCQILNYSIGNISNNEVGSVSSFWTLLFNGDLIFHFITLSMK